MEVSASWIFWWESRIKRGGESGREMTKIAIRHSHDIPGALVLAIEFIHSLVCILLRTHNLDRRVLRPSAIRVFYSRCVPFVGVEESSWLFRYFVLFRCKSAPTDSVHDHPLTTSFKTISSKSASRSTTARSILGPVPNARLFQGLEKEITWVGFEHGQQTTLRPPRRLSFVQHHLSTVACYASRRSCLKGPAIPGGSPSNNMERREA